MQVVVAEKPAVARDIAQVLGATQKRQGYLVGGGYAVTWALGHLVTLPEPHQIVAGWKKWRTSDLPMLPQRFPLVVIDKTRAQYKVVERLLNHPKTTGVVCATDAGREGELIFRHIVEFAGCQKPVSRLWISSLTPRAIESGFDNLRPGSDYDRLAAAAQGRSRADWLVGMNLSRAYTLAMDDTLSVGRVQTPTLSMIVAREEEIRQFCPEEYLEVWAELPSGATVRGGTFRAQYMGTGLDPNELSRRKPSAKPERLPADGKLAAAIEARLLGAHLSVQRVDVVPGRVRPSLLYDLTDLQRHANRLFGWSAQRTLQVAQELYERHKLISYPRTDSRHLSREAASTLPTIVQQVAPRYQDQLPEAMASLLGANALGSRYVDDARVTDHHAIIPTDRACTLPSEGDAHRLYDLVCRRLLQAYLPDYQFTDTTAYLARVDDRPQAHDILRAKGKVVRELGYRLLDRPTERTVGTSRNGVASAVEGQAGPRPGKAGGAPLPELKVGQLWDVIRTGTEKRKTVPPPHYDDATLLTAMETAGRVVDDRALSDAMRERGLGTPATRSAIIENLITRVYVVRDGRSLKATDKGERLIAAVHEQVKSPAMTGEWEHRLTQIERGDGDLGDFLGAIAAYVSDVVGAVAGADAVQAGELHRNARSAAQANGAAPAGVQRRARTQATQGAGPGGVGGSGSGAPGAGHRVPSHGPKKAGYKAAAGSGCGTTASTAAGQVSAVGSVELFASLSAGRPEIRQGVDGLDATLQAAFGHSRFRPNQRAICERIVGGQNVLVVMPTGAGKSLCYQLPGLCRPGTTLVISPLIALMDDQVVQLQLNGLRAERIHSGCGRLHSREVCKRYLAGELDYLFIAPERLRVPGFGAMIARRPLSLIAIDEAHCISQWGHDFRPDYRMLQQRLPELGHAPVVALTATATERVQGDILEQLGMADAHRAVFGFRRDNIGVEVVEVPGKARTAMLQKLLESPDRLPAIVYAPTRKATEAAAQALSGQLSVGAYHAGLAGEVRDRVQERFLRGDLSVIVATTAFGMGIDKPNVRSVVHLALPGSVEGYYQEIGRAGRDGEPSRAVLMHSFADRKTHEFFFERDYPSTYRLGKLFKLLTDVAQPVGHLARQLKWEVPECERAVEKLWAHGGASVDHEGAVTVADGKWRKPYALQRAHRQQQLKHMIGLAERGGCRMLQLIGHFGDQADHGRPCGMCDVCDPERVIVQQTRSPDSADSRRLSKILERIARDGSAAPPAMGVLFRDTLEGDIDRRGFERMAAALCRAQLAVSFEDSFEKDGEVIEFRRLARGAEWSEGPVPSEAYLSEHVRLIMDHGAGTSERAPRRKATRKPRRGRAKTRRRPVTRVTR